ncbi:metallothionein [Pseudomonas taetrolens]|uniref:metallothionein n=1 Tax=Pseudomonas taetrolens TaxID=47884 RepID=UPI0030D82F6E
MSNPSADLPCACPDCSCTCPADQAHQRNGKSYCSEACADLHFQGQPCPDPGCHCEQGMRLQADRFTDSSTGRSR